MNDPIDIYFLIPPQVQVLDIAGPIQVFYEAKEYGGLFDLHFIALHTSESVASSAGIGFSNLTSFELAKPRKGDILFIPGLERGLLFDRDFRSSCAGFFNWLREMEALGVKICTVCTGAFVLGMAGMLDHRKCTTHWKYHERLKEMFPATTCLSDRLFVQDGLLYTSAGVSSGIDLALFLLEEIQGPNFVSKISKEIVVYMRRGQNDPQLSVFLQYRNHLENRIHQVQDYLAQHLDKALTLETLSEEVNMSPRNLSRLFKKTTGLTLGEYRDKLRMEKASQLLQTGEKTDVVSMACGLKSSNQLRSIFRKFSTDIPQNLS